MGIRFGWAGAAALACGLLSTDPASADDAADVRAVLDRQVACWNRKDLDGFLDTYWNSPDVVFLSGADRTQGIEGVRARYKARYQGEGREMGTLDFREIEVVVLSPDAAFARGRWRLTLANGDRPQGLYTLLLRKMAEGWRIVHDHTSK